MAKTIELPKRCKGFQNGAKECIVWISARASQRVFTCKIWLRYSLPLRYLQFLKIVRSIYLSTAAAAAENEPCKVCPLSAYRPPRFAVTRRHLRLPQGAAAPSLALCHIWQHLCYYFGNILPACWQHLVRFRLCLQRFSK